MNFVVFLQAEHRTMAAFVLSVIVNEYPIGQVRDKVLCFDHGSSIHESVH